MVTVALFADYIRSVRVAKTIALVFSWIIWAAGTLMVCFTRLVADFRSTVGGDSLNTCRRRRFWSYVIMPDSIQYSGTRGAV